MSENRLNILVVEDEWLVRECICLYLREVGCGVLEAETGEQAVEHLRGSEPIDAVFTDITLKGGFDGWDVGDAARETSAWHRRSIRFGFCPFAATTGAGKPVSRKTLRSVGSLPRLPPPR